MVTKTELEQAYQAGQAALTEPPERRTVNACPFPDGEERAAWLDGLADAIGGQNDLLAEIRAERPDPTEDPDA